MTKLRCPGSRSKWTTKSVDPRIILAELDNLQAARLQRGDDYHLMASIQDAISLQEERIKEYYPEYASYLEARKDNMKGQNCPYRPITCQESASCRECQIYIDAMVFPSHDALVKREEDLRLSAAERIGK